MRNPLETISLYGMAETFTGGIKHWEYSRKVFAKPKKRKAAERVVIRRRGSSEVRLKP